jgi:5'-methylthioadenosine phosphorylase
MPNLHGMGSGIPLRSSRKDVENWRIGKLASRPWKGLLVELTPRPAGASLAAAVGDASGAVGEIALSSGFRNHEDHMSDWVLGVIGGSGLYEMPGLVEREWIEVETPWGAPSDALLTGRLDGVRMVFLPRHGRGHRLPPSDVNGRANIAALKQLGCTDVLSLSAVGSLKEELSPGTFVIVDQFIDRTFARQKSFFGPGLVAHVSMARPVCPRLSALAAEAGRQAGARLVEGGTYLCMEGPQFSTWAESTLYRSWGCDVIGMTNMPEAKLAREAELPYASVAMVTDYDCWREEDDDVDVAQIVACLHDNAARAQALVARLAAGLRGPRAASPIDTCLDTAIITAPDARDPAMIARLRAVAGRALGG